VTEQPKHGRFRQRIGRPGAVQLGAPQRLVGVDVADPGDQRLVQQRALDLASPPADRLDELRVVELRIHRIPGDVRDLVRQLRAARADRQPAERTLVHKAQLRIAIREAEPDPQVGVVRRAARREPELSRHAEVRDDRIAVVQRQPQVFAASADIGHRTARERVHKVDGTRGVPPDGAWVQHLDRLDRPADGPREQAVADGLHLGQFGHLRSRTATR